MNSPATKLIKFMHIGKCGGTHFSHIADDFNLNQTHFKIRQLRHLHNIDTIGADECYLFSIRDPLTRFVSAFNSRKRQGLPRALNLWSEEEEWLYENFEFANDIAEALFDQKKHSDALRGIEANLHLRKKQTDWFSAKPDFLKTKPPLSIIRVEHYEEDVLRLFAKIAPDFEPRFRKADNERHSDTFKEFETPLSERARANITEFYASDFEFYRKCEEWINS